MTTHSSLDPGGESLQNAPSRACAKHGGIDAQSFAGLIELQRLVQTSDSDMNAVMCLITDRATKVANASGVGLALLEADQLLYRAGSGSAAAYVGTCMTAVLSLPAHGLATSEILRVENAETDSRIEGAICRELGARSVLMLPICQQGVVAGVLQVAFNEPHIFLDQEVRTYRIIVEIIEDSILGRIRSDKRGPLATQVAASPNVPDNSKEQVRVSPVEFKAGALPPLKAVHNRIAASAATLCRSVLGFWHWVATVIKSQSPLPRPLFDSLRWNLAPLLMVAVLVIAVSWISYFSRSIGDGPMRPSSTAPAQSWSKQLPKKLSRKGRALAGAGEELQQSANSRYRRVPVNENEIDYVSEDVTIRHFGYTTPVRQPRFAYKQVNLGNDVTVRYFESNPPVLTRPVAAESAAPISK